MKHTLSIVVENKPGVLTRVAGLFARRGFNIESLAVGLSEDPRFSRITIVIDGDEHPVDQVTKQLHKLINVLKIRDLEPGNSVSAELLLVRVAGEGEKRTEALQIAEIFNAKIVDVDRRSLTLRVVGTNDKLEALLELLQPLGVLEVVRTGTIAMGRGEARRAGRAATVGRLRGSPADGSGRGAVARHALQQRDGSRRRSSVARRPRRSRPDDRHPIRDWLAGVPPRVGRPTTPAPIAALFRRTTCATSRRPTGSRSTASRRDQRVLARRGGGRHPVGVRVPGAGPGGRPVRRPRRDDLPGGDERGGGPRDVPQPLAGDARRRRQGAASSSSTSCS